jgi:collagenase-like PrtC family protease
VCSPPSAVRWDDTPAGVEARLNGVLIDRYAADEPRGYPTLCKGRFEVAGERDYALEEPTSLNTLSMLPQLIEAGVKAIKIEGRQRSPSYVADSAAAGARRSTPSPASERTLQRCRPPLAARSWRLGPRASSTRRRTYGPCPGWP